MNIEFEETTLPGQPRTMMKKVAELRLRAADLVDRTFSACPNSHIERIQGGLSLKGEIANQWRESLLATSRAWAELDRLMKLMESVVDNMPAPRPLPWKLREVAAGADDNDEELSTLEPTGGCAES